MRDFDSYDAAIEAVIEAGFEYIDDSNQNSSTYSFAPTILFRRDGQDVTEPSLLGQRMNWTEPEQEILRYAYDFYVNFHGGTSIRRPSLRRLFRSLDGEMAACWRPTRITPKAAAQMRAGDFSDASMQGLHRDHHQPLARMIYALLDRAEPAGFEEWCQVWWDTGSDGSRSYDLDACLSIPWDRSWTPAGIKSLPRSKAARAAYQEALAC